MKKIFGLLLLLLITTTLSYAEQPNVGVVNMLAVSEGYERYIAGRKVLEAKKAELQTVVDQEEQSILQLIEELEAIRATASQDEIRNRRAEIEKRDKELREFVFQTNSQFRDELDTLQFKTKDEVESVVIDISKRLGLTLVLEMNMTLYTAPSLDITNQVIAELNARYKPVVSSGTERSIAPSTPSTSPTAIPSTPPSSNSGNRGWPFTSR